MFARPFSIGFDHIDQKMMLGLFMLGWVSSCYLLSVTAYLALALIDAPCSVIFKDWTQPLLNLLHFHSSYCSLQLGFRSCSPLSLSFITGWSETSQSAGGVCVVSDASLMAVAG